MHNVAVGEARLSRVGAGSLAHPSRSLPFLLPSRAQGSPPHASLCLSHCLTPSCSVSSLVEFVTTHTTPPCLHHPETVAATVCVVVSECVHECVCWDLWEG